MLGVQSVIAASRAAAADAFGREIRLVRIVKARNEGEERAYRGGLHSMLN